jgi:uncharacterized membrane protein YgdD (TMEM256/DUF423 family)
VSATKKKDNVRRAAGIGVLLLGGILLFIGIFGVISMPLNWSYKTSLVMGGLILIVGFCMVAIKQL